MTSWNGKRLLPSSVAGQLVTDASHIGWGCHYGDQATYSTWDAHMSHQHSNVRELVAVLLSLKALLPLLKSKSIQILSDNVTTVAYINQMGGPIGNLTDISKQIWKIALEDNITLHARYLVERRIREPTNSRMEDKYEWMLSRPMFHLLDSVWGPHTVDRFASALTTQLPTYNSRYWDPNGMRVDALAQSDWHLENNFINPPIRLLDRVLHLI
ncbi:uncharacterized protein [Macrobrachium rosenbergii]|uniref:uncharacterized protein n=1 Tax=Macrobrachium rosenbergii TaxID=79674 RepID=UPI0034D6E7EA